MARKPKNYANFETKEDFNKCFDSVYSSGYSSGYEDGLAEAVSYMFEMLDHFGYDTQRKGERMNGDRKRRAAIENMKRGIVPVIPDDPAIRESRKAMQRWQSFKAFVKKEVLDKVDES